MESTGRDTIGMYLPKNTGRSSNTKGAQGYNEVGQCRGSIETPKTIEGICGETGRKDGKHQDGQKWTSGCVPTCAPR